MPADLQPALDGGTASRARREGIVTAIRWNGVNRQIGRYVREESESSLRAYREQPNFVDEHANHEQDTARGGYARRQIVELVQNSADQLSSGGRIEIRLTGTHLLAGSSGGRIEIRLTGTHLLCADDGLPIDREGVRALMHSRLSPKRETEQIGRFGIGFKSVLRVTDSPAVFSRSGSFQFDRAQAADRINAVVPNAAHYPVLRVAEPIDPRLEARSDPSLRPLMTWAVNIVRLAVKPAERDNLAEQFRSFEPEFLLFVPHVERLELTADDDDARRSLRLTGLDGEIELRDNDRATRWIVFSRTHELSETARADRRTLDSTDRIRLSWAAPIGARLGTGRFWAFFPTLTLSNLAGILNAPWKTNEDRQNLLDGPYNDELIDAAAGLAAEELPQLATPGDPARHLDALPLRPESEDNHHAQRLRLKLYEVLGTRPIAPDQDGRLQAVTAMAYPPEAVSSGRREQTALALDRWSAYPHRPSNWLHHSALTRERLARLNRLVDPRVETNRWHASGVPHAPISDWLEALVRAGAGVGDPIQASMAAIQTAAAMPTEARKDGDLGCIVFTAAEGWADPRADRLYMGQGDPATTVHPDLQSCPVTHNALHTLGISARSSESRLRELATVLSEVHGEAAREDIRWHDFWNAARECNAQAIRTVVAECFPTTVAVRVLTVNDTWEPLNEVLLPGPIVSVDGEHDEYATVDNGFHEADRALLGALGVVTEPHGNYEMAPGNLTDSYVRRWQDAFMRSSIGKPQRDYLRFDSLVSSGPLDVFQYLSEGARAVFTEKLLCLEETFQKLTMRHSTQTRYGEREFDAPAIEVLRERGVVRLSDGFHALAGGLGEKPENREVQRWLLEHENTERIRAAFSDLQTNFGTLKALGAEEAVPLRDLWPGLDRVQWCESGETLWAEYADRMVVRCERIVDAAGEPAPVECVQRNNDILLVRMAEERLELEAVAREVDAWGVMDEQMLDAILDYVPPHELEAARAEVRSCASDAARLLAAVGEEALRAGLPKSLQEILSVGREPFVGVRVAEAAIATYHTGALREFRSDLGDLDPPAQWAGGARAVQFVRSLGFGDEWAGERAPKKAGFVEVVGPYSLPDLHEYQRVAATNVRAMLGRSGTEGENRGLLSLPTGSGKTRVAVQAIIEGIRSDGFEGAILWVADRQELCEQAVEAWRQAWGSIGPREAPLRISRWWAGQATPAAAIADAHVIVATVQTLRARMNGHDATRNLLSEVALLVVDEAHGSIAPSYTHLMAELGLTFRRGDDEICLLGLTATPYRGRDWEETERLVKRYGSNRLDSGALESDDAEGVIGELQDMAVLAEVDHGTVEGMRLWLTEEELQQARRAPWLPDSAQEHLAENASRTRRIVEAYKVEAQRIGRESPTLIFATSVSHAETIAALLTLEGVAARAVTGNTNAGVRRDVVDRFRCGDVKVLVNYGVFREGFDAPKTRIIIVARPVYSPNLYFQMIGRGLRGARNGGSERCLILNVEDNIENYERSLAFSELDWLWA